MRRKTARIIAASTALMLAVLTLAGGCASADPAQPAQPPGSQYSQSINGKSPTNGTLQENDEAAVVINAQWLGEKDGFLVVGVSMNTHSVDLDQYDLSGLSVLTDDSGKDYAPISWSAPAGGHHRQGALSFPIPDSLKQGQAEYLKLIVRGVAGVEQRVFEWRF